MEKPLLPGKSVAAAWVLPFLSKETAAWQNRILMCWFVVAK